MKKMMISFCFLLVVLIGSVSAAVYYVSPDGQASWANCRSNIPLSGASACSDKTAIDNVKAGDTVYFRSGTYHRVLTLKNSNAVSEYDRILIAGYPNDTSRPIIDGEYTIPNFGSCNSEQDCDDDCNPERDDYEKCVELRKCDLNYHVCGNGACDPISKNCATAQNLISIDGKYITVQGFDVTRSHGRGIGIGGGENIVKNCLVHNNRNSGVLIYKASPNHLIENNSVWESGDFARYSRGATQLDWPGGIAWRATKNVTIKGNNVFNNWGEGIMPMESNGVKIIGNMVYDNYAAEIYLASSNNILVEGNLVFNSGDSTYFRGKTLVVEFGLLTNLKCVIILIHPVGQIILRLLITY